MLKSHALCHWRRLLHHRVHQPRPFGCGLNAGGSSPVVSAWQNTGLRRDETTQINSNALVHTEENFWWKGWSHVPQFEAHRVGVQEILRCGSRKSLNAFVAFKRSTKNNSNLYFFKEEIPEFDSSKQLLALKTNWSFSCFTAIRKVF